MLGRGRSITSTRLTIHAKSRKRMARAYVRAKISHSKSVGATAAPPRSVMNSRRFSLSNAIRCPMSRDHTAGYPIRKDRSAGMPAISQPTGCWPRPSESASGHSHHCGARWVCPLDLSERKFPRRSLALSLSNVPYPSAPVGWGSIPFAHRPPTGRGRGLGRRGASAAACSSASRRR